MDCDNCAWAVAELEQQLEELRSKCRPIEIKYAEDGTPLNVPRMRGFFCGRRNDKTDCGVFVG